MVQAEMQKEMVIKVSVIIPVYNAEAFLEQMLESVCLQTLREIEILCVDDGSTDRSPEILEKFRKTDARIRVVRQENRGCGAVRNTMIREARGEYLSFLDADDYFERNLLEEVYHAAKTAKADIAVFRSDEDNDRSEGTVSTRWTIKKSLLPDHTPFAGREIKEDRFNAFVSWSWDKLFRREFVLEHGLRFMEIRNDGDIAFVLPAIAFAEKIVIVDQILGHHRKWSMSLSNTRNQGWECVCQSLRSVKEQLVKAGIYNDWERDFIANSLYCLLRGMNKINGDAYRQLYQKLKEEWFAEFHITEHDADYFWNQWEYQQMRAIIEMEPDRFLYWQRDELKDQLTDVRRELHEQKIIVRQVQKENGKLQKRISDFENSNSWKIGRVVTSVPRAFKGRKVRSE